MVEEVKLELYLVVGWDNAQWVRIGGVKSAV